MPQTRMKTMTDRGLRGLKARDKQYEVSDPDTLGLSLRVLPSGAKRWSYRYRNGKRWSRVALGPFPDVGLADARDLAREHTRSIRKEGRDPAREKREARDARDDTFRGLCTLYLDRHALGPKAGPRQQRKAAGQPPKGTLVAADGTAADVWEIEAVEGSPRKRSWKTDRRMLQAEIPASWWRRPVGEITRRDVRELVEAKALVHPIQANRLRALLHKIFAFALEREAIEYNPVTGTPRPGQERQRERVLSEDEIRTFWQATEAMDPPMRAWWRLRLVTAQRAAEVNSMKWDDLDLETNVWTVPAGVIKNKRSHRVPLSDLAVEIVTGLPRVQGQDYVLAGARGKRQQAEAGKTIEIEDFQGHDLRRTAATFMARAKVPRLHISKVLNHTERGVTAVYERHSYEPEMRVALETWARKLRVILDRSKGGAVVPISAGSRR